MKEYVSQYLDYISDNVKTVSETLVVLTQLELTYKKTLAITACVKVSNFPFYKPIEEFNFDYQTSIDKLKILSFMDLKFIEKGENIIFCG